MVVSRLDRLLTHSAHTGDCLTLSRRNCGLLTYPRRPLELLLRLARLPELVDVGDPLKAVNHHQHHHRYHHHDHPSHLWQQMNTSTIMSPIWESLISLDLWCTMLAVACSEISSFWIVVVIILYLDILLSKLLSFVYISPEWFSV